MSDTTPWANAQDKIEASSAEQTQAATSTAAGSGGAAVAVEETTDERTEPREDEAATSQPEPLPKDVRFDILKNRRRRLVLRYLLDNEGPVTLGTLSEHVAAIENDKGPEALNSRERKRAYVGLYQCHLPRMDDAGVIEYDQNRGTIALGEHAEELGPHLRDTDTVAERWPRIYLLLASVGAGGYLISYSSAVSAAWLGTALVGVVITAFLAASTLQLAQEREAA